MSIAEINKIDWVLGKKILYKGRVYDVVAVDFEEALIGIFDKEDKDHISFKRFENCELVNP